MSRPPIILTLFISLHLNGYPQDFFSKLNFKPYFIVGDSVNMRKDSSLTSDICFKVNYGEEFECCKISNDWYAWTTGFENGFVSSKFIADEETFVRLAENLQKKNGTTLHSLAKHYKKVGLLNKADSLSIEIINQFKNKYFPVYGERCPLYGEEAFYEIVCDSNFEINYTEQNLCNFCSKVVEQSKDTFITNLALYSLAKYNLLKNNFDKSKLQLLKCITDNSRYLLVPTTCIEYGKVETSLIVDIKNLVFILYHLGNLEFQSNLSSDLSKICFDKDAKEESKSAACDLWKNISGGFWENK